MAFITLYSASIYQSSSHISQITASEFGRPISTITGSFDRINTGIYAFVSSGSFTGASGSYTGSIAFKVNQTFISSSSPTTSSIFLYSSGSNPNAVFLVTYSNYFTANPILSDSTVSSGSCNIEIGIQTL